MTIQEENICTYLQQTVEQADWQISHPQQGFTFGQRFIARSPHHNVFVKLGADYRVVRHLSDAHLTPRYLAGGPFANTWITVQEYVEASHPDPGWYTVNKLTLAHLLKTLQSQSGLRRYLPSVENEAYSTLLTRYVQQSKDLYQQQATMDQERRQVIEILLEQYEQRLPFIEGSGLVPSHGDPNPGNLLVTPTIAYLIDWDTLHLSDPIRDIAQILWWMYPRSQWSDLLDLFHIDFANTQQRERFYLYISTRALQVSLFFIQIQHEHFARRFLTDAKLAFKQKPPDEFVPL